MLYNNGGSITVYTGGSFYDVFGDGKVVYSAMLPRLLSGDFVLLGGSLPENARLFGGFDRSQQGLITWDKGKYSQFLGVGDKLWGVTLGAISKTPPAGDASLLAFAAAEQLGPFKNGSMFPVLATAITTPPPPTASISAVVHGGSFLPVPLAPGTWFSVLGVNLGTRATASDTNTFQLGGASIAVCGFPAILNYNSGATQSAPDVSSWQINALMPNGVLGHQSCPVVITVNEQQAAPYSVAITDESLELFQFLAPAIDASTPAVVLPVVTHADYSLVGPLSYSTQSITLTPAKAGEIIILWGTGCKATTNPVVKINGTPAHVLFAGIVSLGLCQLNVIVPSDTPSGTATLTPIPGS